MAPGAECVEAGRLRRGSQGGWSTAGSSPYPGVCTGGRGAGPPPSEAELWPATRWVPAVLWGPCAWATLLSEPPNPCGPGGLKGYLNPSHGPSLPAAPKAAQFSVLTFAELHSPPEPHWVSWATHSGGTSHPHGGLPPDLCLLVTPPPELPLTLRLSRTMRFGGAPTDDSVESPRLSALVNHIFKAPLAEKVACFHFHWYSCWWGVGGGEGHCTANTGNPPASLPG